MKLRNGTFLAALAVSLLLHLLAIPISVRVYFGGLNPGDEAGQKGERFEEMVIRIEDARDLVAPPADDPIAEPPDLKDPVEKAPEAMKTPDAETPPAPEPPKPEPKKPKQELDEFNLGDAKGVGFASHDTPGDREAMAKQAHEDQAFLSRDPVGTGRVGNEPSQNVNQGSNGQGGTPGTPAPEAAPKPLQARTGTQGTLGAIVKLPTPEQITARVTQWAAKLRGENAGTAAAQSPAKSSSTSLAAPKPSPPAPGKAAGAKEEVARAQETGATLAVGAAIPTHRSPRIAAAPIVDAKSLPTQSDVRVGPDLAIGGNDAPAVTVTKNIVPPIGVERVGEDPTPQPVQQQAVAVQAGTGDGRAPGSNSPAADPAPMTENESDAFSKLGSVIRRDGKLDIRFGRKVKSVRPRLTLAGQIDLMAMDEPQIVLDVAIDATGRVTGVEVFKSSGSNEVDQPCRRTMYEWWFEPRKDKKGNPLPDRFKFTINWIK